MMVLRSIGGVLVLVCATQAGADIAGEPSRVHVIQGANIVTEPGAKPVLGSIVIRDGRIQMLGTGVEVPRDAIVHPRSGRTVYAGFIEPYLRLPEGADAPTGPSRTEKAGRTYHENARVRSHVRAVESLPLPPELAKEMREAGFTTALIAPRHGIFRGSAPVISLGEGNPSDQVIYRDRAHVYAFERGQWSERTYPNSLMGTIALTRQTLLDAGWHRDSWAAWNEDPASMERPPENSSLRALAPVLEKRMPLFFESEDSRMLPRALAIAREYDLAPVIVSAGSDEYRDYERVKQWLAQSKASLVVTLDFPKPPTWEDEEESVAIELEELRHWERAPTNPAKLEQSEIAFSVTTQGLESRSDVLARMRQAIRHGLSEAGALAALTTEPAALLGIIERAGTIESGKNANLVVTTGDVFAPGTEIEEVWVDGVRYGEDPKRATEQNVEGKWDLVWGEGDTRRELRISLRREDGGVFEGSVVAPAAARGEPEPAKVLLEELGVHRGELTFEVSEEAGLGGRASFALERDFRILTGGVEIAGERHPVAARVAPAAEPDEPVDVLSEHAREWPPEYELSARPSVVHVKNATIWTCGPDGIVENADLLVVDGKVKAVGRNLETPRGGTVIDGAGRHVTPGLIDCHSHGSISGGVNEGTNSCTAEVRIADVVDPRSLGIYRELAGGLTVSNLLHGSANAIGGQSAVIKLRWGQPAEDLLFEGAKPGIKFALGENVKRSSRGDDTLARYPQTRMGVEQFLRDRLHAAENYRQEWEEWRADRRGAAPRRDLQLDALLEILDGERLVHCHSFRSDEIIMLIRVAEDFGFRIGTFQHVLEGYKCANEIALHGAGAATFSDWWSDEHEAIDAIPYAGEIMWRRGVNTSFNSDSWEVSRRMNLEGAKAAKFGGVPEEEALGFVTINPAVQLGIDGRVGSLEPEKDADFVVWSANPLSDFAVCEETWIDGALRFSRKEDLAARRGALELREQLLVKAREAWKKKDLDGEPTSPPPSAFGRVWGAGVGENGRRLEPGDCLETVRPGCCGGHS